MLNVTVMQIDKDYFIRDNASGILSKPLDHQPTLLDIGKFELSITPEKLLFSLVKAEL